MKFFLKVLVVLLPMLSGLNVYAAKPAEKNKPAVIGVACDCENGKFVVKQSYINSVVKAGGVPVILPPTPDSLTIAHYLRNIDGLVIVGGDDVDPALYGEKVLPECGRIDTLRDAFELPLCRMAIAADIPLLAICRGEQVLNVALGGSLWQDIPSQVEGSPIHRNVRHEIAVDTTSFLYKLCGVRRAEVNSFHHQAVKDAAPSVKITAASADGIVEAFELVEASGKGSDSGRGSGKSRPRLKAIAVQFHPEAMLEAGDTTFLPLFEWVVRGKF